VRHDRVRGGRGNFRDSETYGAGDRPIASPRQRRLRTVCLGLATVATVLLVARGMARSPDKAEFKALQSFSYPAALGRLQRKPRANATSIRSASRGRTQQAFASIVTVSAPIVLDCYPPLVLPNCGEYTGSVVVAINTSQPNSTVYYTLDGSTPTLASPVYVPPLTLVQTGTIVSAVEVDDSTDGTGTCAMSPVQVSRAFQIKTNMPVLAPNCGNFLLGAATLNTVTITASPGAMIYYFVQVRDKIPRTMAQFKPYETPIKIVRAVAKSGGS
jgi:hypothetical protein